jgi:ATP phosphoribosyltransferase
VSSEANEKLILALPKGRIMREAAPLLARAGIEPEAAFADPDARQLRFTTSHPDLDIIRVRSFDVATFVAFGAAHLGIAGADVLMEFDYPEIYAPIDLGIGQCRLAVAEPVEMAGSDDPRRWSHVRIATKYPEVTRRHFAARGVQAECVKLSGAMELAPSLGLSHRIVDLVDSGRTLKENGLVAFHRQPRRAQDAARAHRPLGRPVPRDRPCRLDSTPRRRGSSATSRLSSRATAIPMRMSTASRRRSWPTCGRAATRRWSTTRTSSIA